MNILLIILIFILIFFLIKTSNNNLMSNNDNKQYKINYDLNQTLIDSKSIKEKKKLLNYDHYNIGIDNDVDRFLNTKSEFDYGHFNQIVENGNLHNKNIKKVYDDLITDYKKINKKKEILEDNNEIIIYKDENIENGGIITDKNNNELFAFDQIINYSNF